MIHANSQLHLSCRMSNDMVITAPHAPITHHLCLCQSSSGLFVKIFVDVKEHGSKETIQEHVSGILYGVCEKHIGPI